MMTAFQLRQATVADARVIARHRAEMFTDMGQLPRHLYDSLVDCTTSYLQQEMPTGNYLGWLAAPADTPSEIIGGAGVLLRRVPPHPINGPDGYVLAEGRQGIILNVYTERFWRRRGVAEMLMRHILTWADNSGLETLVLHASDEGRRLYERLGFVASNEMRYAGALLMRGSTREAHGDNLD